MKTMLNKLLRAVIAAGLAAIFLFSAACGTANAPKSSEGTQSAAAPPAIAESSSVPDEPAQPKQEEPPKLSYLTEKDFTKITLQRDVLVPYEDPTNISMFGELVKGNSPYELWARALTVSPNQNYLVIAYNISEHPETPEDEYGPVHYWLSVRDRTGAEHKFYELANTDIVQDWSSLWVDDETVLINNCLLYHIPTKELHIVQFPYPETANEIFQSWNGWDQVLLWDWGSDSNVQISPDKKHLLYHLDMALDTILLVYSLTDYEWIPIYKPTISNESNAPWDTDRHTGYWDGEKVIHTIVSRQGETTVQFQTLEFDPQTRQEKVLHQTQYEAMEMKGWEFGYFYIITDYENKMIFRLRSTDKVPYTNKMLLYNAAKGEMEASMRLEKDEEVSFLGFNKNNPEQIMIESQDDIIICDFANATKYILPITDWPQEGEESFRLENGHLTVWLLVDGKTKPDQEYEIVIDGVPFVPTY